MAEVERPGTPDAPGRLFAQVEPLPDEDGEEQPGTLLQLMYEQSGAVRRSRS